MIVALVILVGLAAIAVMLGKSTTNPNIQATKAWEAAIEKENSSVNKTLLRVARPVSRSNLIQQESASPAYRSLQRKLLASGTFSGSVEIYLAVQIVAFFVGGIVAALTALNINAGSIAIAAGIALASAVVALPWNTVSKGVKSREKAVLEHLPDFAELLQMPLSSGMGVLPALTFTAARMPDSAVTDEVRWMMSYIGNNPTQESEAFVMAGERLGTAESKGFFTSLLQAHIEGAKANATLKRQAEALRKKAYERQRADAKKLPVKIVLIMGLHFLPFLFVLTLLPVFLSFGDVL